MQIGQSRSHDYFIVVHGLVSKDCIQWLTLQRENSKLHFLGHRTALSTTLEFSKVATSPHCSQSGALCSLKLTVCTIQSYTQSAIRNTRLLCPRNSRRLLALTEMPVITNRLHPEQQPSQTRNKYRLNLLVDLIVELDKNFTTLCKYVIEKNLHSFCMHTVPSRHRKLKIR